MMRTLGILLAAGALLATWHSPAVAFFGHQYNERWCLEGSPAYGGFRDCAYRTYRQCEEMQAGVGGYCDRNPAWATAETKRRSRPDRHWR